MIARCRITKVNMCQKLTARQFLTFRFLNKNSDLGDIHDLLTLVLLKSAFLNVINGIYVVVLIFNIFFYFVILIIITFTSQLECVYNISTTESWNVYRNIKPYTRAKKLVHKLITHKLMKIESCNLFLSIGTCRDETQTNRCGFWRDN